MQNESIEPNHWLGEPEAVQRYCEGEIGSEQKANKNETIAIAMVSTYFKILTL